MNYILAHPGRVGALTLVHVEIVAAALTVALAIALPLGILATKRVAQAPYILGFLGAIYTIPSLALLAVLVVLFGLGVLPLFVALVAYAQFMLVRNVVAGLRGVDPAQVDAARGVGMSPMQMLLRIELPLALPVIAGGVRIASIAMIALATLGGYVGAGGLGTLIFTGLTLHHNDEIVAGSIAASLLAILVDLLIRLGQRKLEAAA
ncbi:MAG TPA: ABC transporter permease [Candidatus Baltobacteraceae bacterium]|jgi:osmoprotectant transport system permease protein|nr:ABC transporter permease [Candidatus Baltobacteraceae bacterium]